MKKIFFLAVVGACVLLLASCDAGFKSKKYQLAEGFDFYAYSQLSEAGDTLWGVKKADETVVIEPQAVDGYVTYNDKKLLVAKKGAQRLYYRLNGEPIADRPLKAFKSIAANVYAGDGIIYFVDGEVLEATDTYVSGGYLGYQTKHGFVISPTQGEGVTWTVDEAFFWVQEPEGTSKIVVPSKRVATVYDMSGKKEKDLPVAQWTKIVKKAKDMKVIGAGTVFKVDKEL